MYNNNQAAENCVLWNASQYRYADEEANGAGSDQVSTFQKTVVYQNYATNRVAYTDSPITYIANQIPAK